MFYGWYTLLHALFILNYFFDTHYFLRALFHGILGRFVWKKIKFLDSDSIYGISLTNDLGMALDHMNNARYSREFDFGRLVQTLRSRFFEDFCTKGGAVTVVAGSTTRYRLPLKIFSPYKVVTTIVWWDGKAVYFEQRMISVLDGIVRAVAYVKVVSTSLSIEEFIRDKYPEVEKPSLPEDLQKWIESMEISRRNMKIKS